MKIQANITIERHDGKRLTPRQREEVVEYFSEALGDVDFDIDGLAVFMEVHDVLQVRKHAGGPSHE